MSRFFLPLLMALASVHLACQTHTGGGGEKLALDDFADGMKGAYCDHIEKCGLEWFWKSEEDMCCEDLFWQSTDAFEILVESVQAGRLRYDGESAHECLSSFLSAECYFSADTYQNLMCDRAFTGEVDEGGTCYQNVECGEGFRCVGCPGICQPFKELGEPCDSQSECNQAVADCLEGGLDTRVCTELGDEGDICDYRWDCKEGLTCDRDNEPGICTTPASEGDTCTSEEDCQAFLLCVNQSCSGPAGQGEPCEIDRLKPEVRWNACAPGLYCDANWLDGEELGTCLSKKDSGLECRSFYECRTGLLCIDLWRDPETYQIVPGQCGTPIQAQDLCTPGTIEPECDFTLYCDGQSGTCKPRPVLDDSCSDEARCLGYNLYCERGQSRVCKPKRDAGESCNLDDECLSGDCSNSSCRSYDSCRP
ncbi:MAG: hypothetical protein JRF33_12415 [Deltaproteobacteria bacterium]|nr:hypothetical protein [Deltaproteobacteria bacterium]